MYQSYTPLPGPNFFWNQLAAYLAQHPCQMALDVAAADFVNRPMFRADQYWGVDVSLKRLQAGLAKYADETNSFGLVADVRQALPIHACVDICVSSYTLLYLPPASQVEAVQHLIDTVCQGGSLIIEFPKRANCQTLLDLVRQQFASVQVRYFNSFLSRAYARCLAKPAQLSQWTRPMTWLGEGCYPNLPYGNASVGVFAEDKRQAESRPFDPGELIPCGKRLFRAPGCPLLEAKRVANDAEEVAFVAHQIRQLLDEQVPAHEIAVYAGEPQAVQRLRVGLQEYDPELLFQPALESETQAPGVRISLFRDAPPVPVHTAFIVGTGPRRAVPFFRLPGCARERVFVCSNTARLAGGSDFLMSQGYV